jgi:hypothetical protein
MNWKKAFGILVWIILIVLGIDLALGWINLASTLANVGGLFLLFIIVFISFKTKCFTNFKFKK